MVAGLLLDRNAVVVARLFAVVELVVAFRGFGLCGLFLCFARHTSLDIKPAEQFGITWRAFLAGFFRHEKGALFALHNQCFEGIAGSGRREIGRASCRERVWQYV